MRVNEVQGHDENDDPAQTPSHSGSRMLELWEPGALFLGLHSGGFAIVLDDRTRCHQNVPMARKTSGWAIRELEGFAQARIMQSNRGERIR